MTLSQSAPISIVLFYGQKMSTAFLHLHLLFALKCQSDLAKPSSLLQDHFVHCDDVIQRLVLQCKVYNYILWFFKGILVPLLPIFKNETLKEQPVEIYGRKVNFIVQKCKCIEFPLGGRWLAAGLPYPRKQNTGVLLKFKNFVFTQWPFYAIFYPKLPCFWTKNA